MSLENGDNTIDYCSEILAKYRKDSLIFVKALQTLQYFQMRADYPFCIDEMDEVLKRVLGANLDHLVWLWNTLRTHYKTMVWNLVDVILEENKELYDILLKEMNEKEIQEYVEKFQNDLEAFIYTIEPLLEELFYGNSNMMKVKQIAVKRTYGDERIVRLIRTDNEYLDISVRDSDIDFICKNLTNCKENQ